MMMYVTGMFGTSRLLCSPSLVGEVQTDRTDRQDRQTGQTGRQRQAGTGRLAQKCWGRGLPNVSPSPGSNRVQRIIIDLSPGRTLQSPNPSTHASRSLPHRSGSSRPPLFDLPRAHTALRGREKWALRTDILPGEGPSFYICYQ
jgi:hypothetical protein